MSQVTAGLAQPLPVRQLPLVSLVGVIFFIVCGGTYGLEEAVDQSGPWWTILLVIAIPLFWGIPISLMVAELSTLMPEDGGFYTWVQRELGDFWGSQAGWWALCSSIVDMALYPVLFVRYLSHLIPSLQLDAPVVRWLIAASVAGIALLTNLRGVRPVGRNAVVSLALVMGPLLVFTGMVMWQHSPLGTIAKVMQTPPDQSAIASFATGLSIVIWNYMGWDSASTIAGEVENPQRSYPKALAIVALLTVSVYLAPLLAGLTVFPEAARWSEWTVWPELGERVGGVWLGVAVAMAGLVAQWSLFNSDLLYASRIPCAMARDGWLPSVLARTPGPASPPATALWALSVTAVALAAWPFEKLVVIDVLLYSAVLVLEFAVLIRLRLREPQRPRPFKVPGGWVAITVITLMPAVCLAILLQATFAPSVHEAATGVPAPPGGATENLQLAAVAAIVASGLVLYFATRRRVAAQRTVTRPIEAVSNRA